MREIVIGWTLSPKDGSYSSFAEGYQPGRKQHEETVYVATELEGEALAELVFVALNKPVETMDAGSLEREIYDAVQANYDGHVDDEGYYGHFSLSTGDTVSFDGRTWACGSWGWDEVK